MYNETFSNALFNVFLDAPPLNNVDFWWTDYDGCGNGAWCVRPSPLDGGVVVSTSWSCRACCSRPQPNVLVELRLRHAAGCNQREAPTGAVAIRWAGQSQVMTDPAAGLAALIDLATISDRVMLMLFTVCEQVPHRILWGYVSGMVL